MFSKQALACVALGLFASCASSDNSTTRTGMTEPTATTGTIVGTIASSLGGALPGVRVVVTPAGGNALGAVTTSATGSFVTVNVPTTNQDGTVTLAGLPANCNAPTPTAYAGLTGGDTVIVNVTVTCSPLAAAIRGTVTSNGGPLAGVGVVVTPHGASALAAVLTSTTGAYLVTAVPLGDGTGVIALTNLPSTCTAPAPTSYAGLAFGDTVTVPITVTCTVGGTVVGAVTASTGGPLAGVKVIVTPNGAPPLNAVTTSANGAYTVVGVPAGAGTISISGVPSNCTAPASVAYTGLTNAMTITTNVVVPCVAPTGTISGTITSATIGGIGVIVTPTGASALPAVTPNASGVYAVHNVPVGTGFVSLTGIPTNCAAPIATPYTGLTFNGTVTVNVAVACAPSGSLVVTIAPSTSIAPVTITGPGGYTKTVNATTTLTGLMQGAYTVSAPAFETSDPIVPAVYTAAVTGSPANVTFNGTANVSVTYAQQGGTGGLWVSTINLVNSAAMIGELTSAQLNAAGSQTPTYGASPLQMTAYLGMAFDNQGTLWTADSVSGFVLGFTATQLASGNFSAPAITISVPGMLNPAGLAFDPNGNLWVSAVGTLFKLTPTQLAVGGTLQASSIVSLTALQAPSAVAFDPSGTLWVGCSANNANALCGFTPAQLATLGSINPQDTIVVGSNNQPDALAFDASGTLWVGMHPLQLAPGAIVGYTASQLTSNGAPAPAYSIAFNNGETPLSLAFDASGNLWAALQLSIAEFTPAQLHANGAAPFTTLVQLANQPMALAFDPHATSLPIFGQHVASLVRTPKKIGSPIR